jgi:Fe-S-cluster containining protein
VRVTKLVWPNGYSRIERIVKIWLRRKKKDGWWKCIALKGNVGQSVICTVYDKRPSACSNFDPGSDACKKARQWAGLELTLGVHNLVGNTDINVNQNPLTKGKDAQEE